MLKRTIDSKLLEWKQNWHNKACIINGARQVGKTYSVRAFGRANYETVYELNFIEEPTLTDIFNDSLNADAIINSIRLTFPSQKFVAGNTLLFLDEIQECPQAVTALKFLSKDQRIDVIATGSALGMAYKTSSSHPVGSTHNITMHSLSFEEFLWSHGIDDDIISTLHKHFESKTPVPLAMHKKMLELLRQYLVVGGMPEVVQTYVDTHDLAKVHTLQKNIYCDYIIDIARFSTPDIKIKAENCYKTIPAQLQKENHKFQYSKVEKKGTSRKFESSIDWLENAHLVSRVCNVSRLEYPLASFEMADNFRLYMNDIGLLIATFDFSMKEALLHDNNIEAPAENNLILKTAKGSIYEALAADVLTKSGHENLYFFRNKQGNIEIDFLVESESGVVPVEVKAGAKTKTKSLNRVLENSEILEGYKFGSQNIGVADVEPLAGAKRSETNIPAHKKITMPLYMLMFV